MFKRFPFLIGFTGSALFFLGVNLYAYFGAMSTRGGDSVTEAGFPFRWYSTGWVSEPYVIWNALAVDVLIAIVASIIAGIVIRPVFWPDTYK